uniref:Uncharacterized protein n=1 Tax=Trypanosoma congolense (strain IL3000) TaxID=1068625 RepID=G0UXK9_TRYCI|nr:conserved hypothetical protein [Trypanosoma congolense IL3000]
MGHTGLKRDNVLVPIKSVCWIAKNVFSVKVPLYRKTISCELTAVDIPRGTASVLENAVQLAVDMVERAPEKYLQQDYYTEFPLIGYGDVVFATNEGATEWASLQETLLRLGVGRIIRPVATRLENIIQAEKEGEECVNDRGSSITLCQWAMNMSRRESGEQFCKSFTGRIIDVLQGDVYVVRWDGVVSASDGAVSSVDGVVEGGAGSTSDGRFTNSLPPELVILDAVVCYPASTDAGYASLQWARQHLIFSRVEVCVHCISPSEMDVANNTQVFTYDQLRCARSTVRVIEKARGGDNIDDIGCALVSKGLGLVRQVVEAALPRAKNFHDVLRASYKYCCGVDSAPAAGVAVLGVEDEGWLLGESHVNNDSKESLKRFLGPGWGKELSVVALWKKAMYAGDMRCSQHDWPRRTRSHRPMRMMWNIEVPVRQRMTFEGTLQSFVLVRESLETSLSRRGGDHGTASEHAGGEIPQTPSLFLRAEVDVRVSHRALLRALEKDQATTCGCITINPPGDDEVQGRRLRVSIVYDRSMSIIPPGEKALIRVCVRGCGLDEYDEGNIDLPFLFSKDAECDVYRSEIKLDLQLPDGKEGAIFVLEIAVDFQGRRETLGQRAVYRLRDAAKLINDDYLSSESDSDVADDGGEEGAQNIGESRANGPTVNGAQQLLEGRGSELGKIPGEVDLNDILSERIYNSTVDFYFKIDSSKLSSENFMKDFRGWCEGMVYRDVACIPVGVAIINGHQGYVGDVLVYDGNSSVGTGCNECVRRSLLFELGSRWFSAEEHPPSSIGCAWLSIPKLLQKQYAVLIKEVVSEERQLRGSLFNQWSAHVSVMWAEVESVGIAVGKELIQWTSESADVLSSYELAKDGVDGQGAHQGVFCITHGTCRLWHVTEWELLNTPDSPGLARREGYRTSFPPPLSTWFLPTCLSLFSLSVFPRQLFSAHRKHHRSFVTKQGDPTTKQNSKLHVDAAFMRLNRHFLSNLYASNLERMPLSLRNVNRAFCDSLMREEFPKMTDAGEEILYAVEGVFSALASLIFMLTPQASAAKLSSHAYGCVYDLLDSDFRQHCGVSVPKVCHSAVLYRVYPQPQSDANNQKKVEPFLFLGPRCSSADEILGDRLSVLPNDKFIIRRIVSALGIESLTGSHTAACPPSDCSSNFDISGDREVTRLLERGGEACYPMASRGIPSDPLVASTPRFYRPLPWLAVLGQPVFVRNEVDPSSADLSGGEQMQKRHVAVTYVPMHCTSSKAYKSFSYGQCKRQLIYQQEMKRSMNGSGVKDYFSLLLRSNKSARAEGSLRRVFPDGALRVYGTANEPLFLYYLSRRQLRFRLGALWPSILEGPGGAKDTTHAELEAEEELLKNVAEAVRRIIKMVKEKTDMRDSCSEGCDGQSAPPSRVYLDFSLYFHPENTHKLRVSVYPVSEEGDGEAPIDRNQNPYRPFQMDGNVFGRSKRHVLVVGYCPGTNMYTYEWDKDYEIA